MLRRILNADDFRTELLRRFAKAIDDGRTQLDVNAGEMHRALGGYPGKQHRMPLCCWVMYSLQQLGDDVLAKPPRGYGARLTIRYSLPRSHQPEAIRSSGDRRKIP